MRCHRRKQRTATPTHCHQQAAPCNGMRPLTSSRARNCRTPGSSQAGRPARGRPCRSRRRNDDAGVGSSTTASAADSPPEAPGNCTCARCQVAAGHPPLWGLVSWAGWRTAVLSLRQDAGTRLAYSTLGAASSAALAPQSHHCTDPADEPLRAARGARHHSRCMSGPVRPPKQLRPRPRLQEHHHLLLKVVWPVGGGAKRRCGCGGLCKGWKEWGWLLCCCFTLAPLPLCRCRPGVSVMGDVHGQDLN